MLYLEGEVAKDTYETMTASAEVSTCDPDLHTKSADALEHSLSKAGEYTCSIGVSQERGTSVKASVC